MFGWGALGIFFCSSDLVQVCFGEKYVLSPEIPFVMALNFFSVGMMNTVWTYKHTLGLFHYGRFIQFFTGVLNVVFSVILGTYWGLFGILFATFIARAMTSLWYDPYAVFKSGFHCPIGEYVRKIVKYILVLTVAFLGCWLCFQFVDRLPLAASIFLKLVLCSAIANVTFFFAFRHTPEFLKLREIASRVIYPFICKIKGNHQA